MYTFVYSKFNLYIIYINPFKFVSVIYLHPLIHIYIMIIVHIIYSTSLILLDVANQTLHGFDILQIYLFN